MTAWLQTCVKAPVLEREIGGRRLLESQPFPERGAQAVQLLQGVGYANAAQVDSGGPAAALASQPYGGSPVAAAQVQDRRVRADAALLDHHPVQVFAGLQEVVAGAAVEETPVDAAILVPNGTVDGIFSVVIGLGF